MMQREHVHETSTTMPSEISSIWPSWAKLQWCLMIGQSKHATMFPWISWQESLTAKSTVGMPQSARKKAKQVSGVASHLSFSGPWPVVSCNIISQVISTTYYYLATSVPSPIFASCFVSVRHQIRGCTAAYKVRLNQPCVLNLSQRQGAPFGVGNGRLPKRLMRGLKMYCKLPSKHAAASVAWFAGPSDRSAAILAGEMVPLDANIVTGSAGVAWSPQHPC